MAERKQCEFLLLRYEPDAVKGEFVHIGILLFGPEGPGAARVRFTTDWERVRCIDPAADIEMLEALGTEIEKKLEKAGDERDGLLKLLDDSFSNLVQASDFKPVLADDLDVEIEKLAKIFLESDRNQRQLRGTGARTSIARRIRRAFEEAGVWDLMQHRVAVSKYTGAGDPLKLDCGYKPNGVVRFFHGVSLNSDVNLAKVLAFSLPKIEASIEKEYAAKTELTAVVEDDVDRESESIAFAVETMEKSGIMVAATSQLKALAERARQELRV